MLNGRPRQRDDLLFHLRTRTPHELWLVIVDASASTRRHQALSDAKGLLAQLFDDAYRQRARLALLTASGQLPKWQVQGLKASAGLRDWLEGLGAGGGTPMLAALGEAGHWLVARQKRFPAEQQRLLLVTDGRLKEAEEFFRKANAIKPMQPALITTWVQVLFQDKQSSLRPRFRR